MQWTGAAAWLGNHLSIDVRAITVLPGGGPGGAPPNPGGGGGIPGGAPIIGIPLATQLSQDCMVGSKNCESAHLTVAVAASRQTLAEGV